jgi:hypothetical protein
MKFALVVLSALVLVTRAATAQTVTTPLLRSVNAHVGASQPLATTPIPADVASPNPIRWRWVLIGAATGAAVGALVGSQLDIVGCDLPAGGTPCDLHAKQRRVTLGVATVGAVVGALAGATAGVIRSHRASALGVLDMRPRQRTDINSSAGASTMLATTDSIARPR